MIRRPPRSTLDRSSAASDVYKRQVLGRVAELTAQIAELTAQRDMTVAEGVAAGARWADIGEALGVSAQAAHRRFRWGVSFTQLPAPQTGLEHACPPFL